MIKLLLAANLILSPVVASASPAAPPEPDRAKPVPMTPAKPVQMPALEESTLKNGLKLALMGLRRLPIVSLQIVLPFAGYKHDPEGKSGLAELTANLLMEGSQNRTGLEFAKALEKLGAEIGFNFADSGYWKTNLWWKDAVVISLFALKENLEPALALTAGMLKEPALPEKELSRIKEETLEQLRQQKSDPDELTRRRLEEKVFGDHPYARQPDEASVNSITHEDIVTAHKNNFAPAIIAASGDISMEELKGLAEKYFPGKGALRETPTQSVPVVVAANIVQGTLNIEIVDQPGSTQSTIEAGHISIARNHPDLVSLIVMNTIFGASMGRLEKNIREAHSWAYYARSLLVALQETGIFKIKTSVQVDKTADSVKEILSELRQMQERPATSEELEKAKKMLCGQFVLGNQKVQDVSESAAKTEVNGLPKDFLAGYRDKIMAVTVEDVQRVARTYLNADAMQFVIAGDAEKIYGELSKIAPVTVYDSDGNPRQMPAI